MPMAFLAGFSFNGSSLKIVLVPLHILLVFDNAIFCDFADPPKMVAICWLGAAPHIGEM
jgi:hypothetical protein